MVLTFIRIRYSELVFTSLPCYNLSYLIYSSFLFYSDFVPTLIKEKIILPDIPDELELKDVEEGSNHASAIFRDPDICEWFVDNVVEPREWQLDHPDEVPSEILKRHYVLLGKIR